MSSSVGTTTRKRSHFDERAKRLMQERYDSTPETTTRLAEMLGVPRERVKKWACHMGLTRPYKHNAWTPDEVAYLEHNLSKTTYATLARKLGRTVSAIESKVYELGLTKYAQDGHTATSLAEGLGCTRSLVVEWIERGWLKASRCHTAREHDVYAISDKALRDFVQTHPTAISFRRVNQLWLLSVLYSDRGGIGALS